MASTNSSGVTSAPGHSAIGARAGDRPIAGEYAERMIGPRAWPETHESVFTERATQLGAVLAGLTGAVEGWAAHTASIFNGDHVWVGSGAGAANAKVGASLQAMLDHQQQLRDAIGWCDQAVGHIGAAKETIRGDVQAGIDDINGKLEAVSGTDHDPTDAIEAVVQRTYDKNRGALKDLATSLGYKDKAPAAPPHRPGEPGEPGPNQPGDRG